MRIGILGTKDVGKALGRGFVALGHEVKMGARDAGNESAADWAKEMGPKASTGTFAAAAGFGEVVVLATLGVAIPAVLGAVGADDLRGKVLIDATNPLDFSQGMPPRLADLGADASAGEQVQRLAPQARVVKAFNTVGHAHMFRPEFAGGPPDMFLCGNDEEAKATVRKILADFGWGSLDVGGIESSHYLEAICVAWVIVALKTGNWNQAFRLLTK
jgi:predicted dinucleotide-binding enzyme